MKTWTTINLIKNMANKVEKETVSYSELARRVGDMIMANSLRNNTEDWESVGGTDAYNCCDNHLYFTPDCDECIKIDDKGDYDYKEIYQEYIITESGAEYLKDNTNEIIFYNDKLDLYLWGITHFGTSWDGVYTEIEGTV